MSISNKEIRVKLVDKPSNDIASSTYNVYVDGGISHSNNSSYDRYDSGKRLFESYSIKGVMNIGDKFENTNVKTLKLEYINSSATEEGQIFTIRDYTVSEYPFLEGMTITYLGGDTNSIDSYEVSVVDCPDDFDPSSTWFSFESSDGGYCDPRFSQELVDGMMILPDGYQVKITNQDSLTVSLYKNSEFIESQYAEVYDYVILNGNDDFERTEINSDKEWTNYYPYITMEDIKRATNVYVNLEIDENGDGTEKCPFNNLQSLVQWYKDNIQIALLQPNDIEVHVIKNDYQMNFPERHKFNTIDLNNSNYTLKLNFGYQQIKAYSDNNTFNFCKLNAHDIYLYSNLDTSFYTSFSDCIISNSIQTHKLGDESSSLQISSASFSNCSLSTSSRLYGTYSTYSNCRSTTGDSLNFTLGSYEGNTDISRINLTVNGCNKVPILKVYPGIRTLALYASEADITLCTPKNQVSFTSTVQCEHQNQGISKHTLRFDPNVPFSVTANFNFDFVNQTFNNEDLTIPLFDNSTRSSSDKGKLNCQIIKSRKVVDGGIVRLNKKNYSTSDGVVGLTFGGSNYDIELQENEVIHK